jgi:hypothetical protein
VDFLARAAVPDPVVAVISSKKAPRADGPTVLTGYRRSWAVLELLRFLSEEGHCPNP